jgi:very-short-patch-repair endonuclease
VVFRRQVPIGRYIADFASRDARLVVEVDGGYHESRRAADARRDRVLRRAGYRVLHVPAELVHRDLAGAVALVRAAVVAG